MGNHAVTTPPRAEGLKVTRSMHAAPEETDIGALLEVVRNDPRQGTKFLAIAEKLTRSGKLRWEDVDLQQLFAATIELPCQVQAFIPGLGKRSLQASAFPILTGLLTTELLERPDDSSKTIYQEITTPRPTNKDTVHLVRIIGGDSSHIGGKRRNEGDPYPLMTSGEERLQVDTIDDGRRLAIGAKVLETNDKAGFMDQVNGLRRWANNRRDVVSILRVYDVYGSGGTPATPYVYRPNGSGTALYTTTTTAHRRAPSGTRVTNNPIVAKENLQALINVLAAMKDEDGYVISMLDELELLAPHALASTIDTLLMSEMTPGVENEINPFGPRGRYRIRPIISPKIDSFTTTSVILGRSIKRQFQLVSRIDMEYVSMPASLQDFLRTRLAFEARIADEFEVGASDHNRCVQSLSGNTPPTGPTLGS